jgi:D-ala D-ala ligase N-terminus
MKKNVVVIFGGDSSEHDVSCLSATTVIKNMDTEKYNDFSWNHKRRKMVISRQCKGY